MDGMISPADIAAVTGNNNGNGMDGFGGSGAWVLIILFALIFGWGRNGFGGGAGGCGGEPVTEAGLCSAMNFNNLENAVGRLNDQMCSQNMMLQQGLASTGYENLRNFNTLSAQMADCCCTTQRAIDQVNYNGAMNTAAINQHMSEQTQKILDVMCGNRMQDMQNQINQLQLQAAMSGVVRYPSGFSYTAGNSPFCGCGWNNGCNSGGCCNI